MTEIDQRDQHEDDDSRSKPPKSVWMKRGKVFAAIVGTAAGLMEIVHGMVRMVAGQ